ncbi:major facilitator superfamily domain-containing protein 3 [Nematostella vectensis]|uniref:major facilitator superfamily domain-containing protein 3 n=1 Tax=Nematostella vectensis TaxID=45351 RepID=UPI00207773DB|nr:major facilitator superfamily domain-containing protein 3 [Nematostella vectensis]
MAMADARHVSFHVFIFILYILQGGLYGLQTRYLPVLLRKSGTSLSFISSLGLVTLIPWVIRPLWSPVINRFSPQRLLQGCMVGIAGSLLLVPLFLHSRAFLVVAFLLNVFSSVKDLVVGSLSLSRSSEVSSIATIKITAYKLGALLAGGGGLWLLPSLSNTGELFNSMALIYIVVMISTRRRNSLIAKQEVTGSSHFANFRHAISEDTYVSTCSSPGTLWLLVCLIIYKFASHGSNMMFTMALVDKGVAVSNIGLVSGIFGHVVSLAIAGLTGTILVSSRTSVTAVQLLVSISGVVSILVQLLTIFGQEAIHENLVFISFALQHVVLGAEATPMYTRILQVTQQAPTRTQATLYSIFSTVETVGVRLGLAAAGVLAEHAGYRVGFAVSLWVSVVVVLMFCFPPQEKNK